MKVACKGWEGEKGTHRIQGLFGMLGGICADNTRRALNIWPVYLGPLDEHLSHSRGLLVLLLCDFLSSAG